MEKRINRLINKSLLDSPVPNSKIKFFPSGIKLLPDPLKPTKYVPPKEKPVAKPRVLSKRPPVPLPRSNLAVREEPSYPKPIDKKVKRLIEEIKPYYKREAITAFDKILRDKKSHRVKITEKRQALKRRAKSFEVAIIEKADPAKQFYYTTPDVEKELESLLSRERGMKVQVTLHIIFKKKKN